MERHDALYHYGILGMKWGVRNDRRFDKAYKLREKARKHQAKAEKLRYKQKHTGLLGDKLVGKAAMGERAKAYEMSADRLRKKAKKHSESYSKPKKKPYTPYSSPEHRKEIRSTTLSDRDKEYNKQVFKQQTIRIGTTVLSAILVGLAKPVATAYGNQLAAKIVPGDIAKEVMGSAAKAAASAATSAATGSSDSAASAAIDELLGAAKTNFFEDL